MKKFSSIILASLLITACNDPQGIEPAYKLEAAPTTLSFASADNSPADITVTAENVEWKLDVAQQYAEWLKAERNGNTISVTVTDNTATDSRTGEIKIRPVDNAGVRAVTISVTQAGIMDKYADYLFEIDRTELEFNGEDNASQQITVTTAGKGLTWECSIEPTGREWITATPDGNVLNVSVTDNPAYTERSAKITLTPSIDVFGSKTVTVTQLPSTVEPYIRPEKTELDFKFIDKEPQIIKVESFGVTWAIKYLGENNGWFSVTGDVRTGELSITVQNNIKSEPRTGQFALYGDKVEDVIITINQEAGTDIMSNLTEDVELAPNTFGHSRVLVNSIQSDNEPFTTWEIRLNSDGLSIDQVGQWHGTGTVMTIIAYSERVHGDEYLYVPSVKYDVDNYFEYGDEYNIVHYPTVRAGELSTWGQRPMYSWYTTFENDEQITAAPLTGGHMTVSREGDVYTLEFDFTDDAMNSITGSYKGEFTEFVIIKNEE